MAAIDSPAIDTRPSDSIPGYKGKRAGDGVILEKVEPSFESSRDRILAVIPAYNEERFIGSVVLQTLQHASTVIVVDDGSTDLTAQIAQSAGALVVQHMQNKGYGAAISTAFAAAILLEKDAVILLDADGQHCPEELCDVVAPILDGNADMVVGSRYLEDEGNVPLLTKIAHKFITGFTNISSGTKITDSQCGFRAFSHKALLDANLTKTGMAAASEFSFLANQHNWRVVEMPVSIQYHKEAIGKRSLTMHGLRVVDGIMRLIGQVRPLLFFGVPGMLVLLAGLAWGWRVVDIYSQWGILAVGYAMISVLLVILGSLGLFTGILLHSIRGLLLGMEYRLKNA